MIYPDLTTYTLEELLEKQNHLMSLIEQTNYSNRAQLQFFLKAYVYEIARRREEARAKAKKAAE